MHEFQIPAYQKMAGSTPDFDRLEKAGFWLDWGADGSGLFAGTCGVGLATIDVGAADLVANGDVKLAHGQVDHLTGTASSSPTGPHWPISSSSPPATTR